MKKITVIIVGNSDEEHSTYIKYNNKYFKFWTDGYDGIKCTELISFLKFLGYEIFEVYKNSFDVPKEDIINY